MWRQLFREFQGTGEMLDARGRKVLEYVPQSRSLETLPAHLDSWTELVEEYAQPLILHCPEQLVVMLKSILPKDLEEELEHPLNAHVKTKEKIIEWCKARASKSKHKILAAHRMKAVGGQASGFVTPLTGSNGEEPEII